MRTAGVVLGVAALQAVTMAGGINVRVDDRGAAHVADARPLARAVVYMHAPGWASAGVGSQGGRYERPPDGLKASIPLPSGCQGALRASLHTEDRGGDTELAYTVSFTHDTAIQGAYVSFMLPASRFEGQTITLLHGGGSSVLPKGKEPCRLDALATGVVVGLDPTQSLVLATDATARVMIQNNRVYGSDEYEVRFHMFPEGRVLPHAQVRRSFVVTKTAPDRAAAKVAAVNPPTSFRLDEPYVLLRPKGELVYGVNRSNLLQVYLAVHGLEWTYATQPQAQARTAGDDRARFVRGVIPVPGADSKVIEFSEAVTADPGGAMGLRYRLHIPEGVRLNGYQLACLAELSRFSGARIRVRTPEGEETFTVPTEHDENFLFRGPVTAVDMAPGNVEGFRVRVDQPTDLLVQDNRGWGGDTVELRFCFMRRETGSKVPPGTTVERLFTLELNRPTQIVLNEALASSQTDTTDWFPFPLPWDQAPCDLSWLNHKPAGKHGFVAVRDGRFVLSDTGEEIRFWGTCFSAGANFPTHEQSEIIARRLAGFGVNIVRTHHADAPWAERHLFRKGADNTREFDPENLDRFDYLMHCLKREGIYVYLDQLVHRKFKAGDDVDSVAELPAAAKPYSNFDPRLIELQKEFSRNLWMHVNPYTKLAYKDDPAIALMEFANENDLFTQKVTLEPYRTRLEARYRAWARDNDVAVGTDTVDFQPPSDDVVRFFVEVQRSFYSEMERYLRDEVGVRVPMTGSNWSRSAALLAALKDMSFTDSHAYWNHPSRDGAFGNTPMVGAGRTIFDGLGFQRLAGKPFFVSEWDEPWPNEWRAELPLWIAAVSALQQWNGLTVYTYRHSTALPVDSISGAFETFNDPARFGLFPHAALLLRRGDVAGGGGNVVVHIPQSSAVGAASPTPYSAPAYRGLSETRPFATVVGPRPEGDALVLDAAKANDVPDDIRESDTGQLWRSVKQRLGRIDTPSSQAVFGFLAKAGKVTTTDVEFRCHNEFATIALSSLTNQPIRLSDRLLLTAVGRAENTGFKYGMLRNKRIDGGAGPILVEPIAARIAMRTEMGRLLVRAIAADGSHLGDVPVRYERGRAVFSLGPPSKTIYYLIMSRRDS